jgi:hypothetical protein
VSDAKASLDAKTRVGIALLGMGGVYLLVGAGYTVRTGTWFVGFPPQLDAIGFIVGSGIVGAYAEAAVAAVLGIACVGAAVGVAISSARRPK